MVVALSTALLVSGEANANTYRYDFEATWAFGADDLVADSPFTIGDSMSGSALIESPDSLGDPFVTGLIESLYLNFDGLGVVTWDISRSPHSYTLGLPSNYFAFSDPLLLLQLEDYLPGNVPLVHDITLVGTGWDDPNSLFTFAISEPSQQQPWTLAFIESNVGSDLIRFRFEAWADNVGTAALISARVTHQTLTAVPEPGPIAAVGASLILLGAMRQYRRP